MLSIYIISLLVICILVGAFSNSDKIFLDPLNRDNTLAWKGLLALFIALHHISFIYNHSNPWIQYSPFPYIGTWVVAVFFIFSGYGLTMQMLSKGVEVYRRNFLSKRFGTILPSFVLLTGLVVTYKYFFGGGSIDYQINNLVSRGVTPLYFSWFVYVILYEYLLMYIAMSISSRPNMVVFMTFIGTALFYIILHRFSDFDYYWYATIFSFNIGSVLALYYKKFKSVSRNQIIYGVLLCISLIAVFSLLKWHFETYHNRNVYYLFSEGCNYFCFVSVIIFWYIFNLSNIKIFLKLGKVSLNFYLCHGIYLMMAKYFQLNLLCAVLFVISMSYFTAYILTKYINISSLRDLYRYSIKSIGYLIRN